MNYTEQRLFLRRSRTWGAVIVIAFVTMVAACLITGGTRTRPALVAIGLTTVALAVCLHCNPDYLHLTVNPQKKPRWEVRVRWRLIGAALVMGMFSVSDRRGALAVLIAVAWLAVANLVGMALVLPRYFSAYFGTTDFILLTALLLETRCDLLLVAVFLAAAAHLSVVVCDSHPFRWAGGATISGWLLILLFSGRRVADLRLSLLLAGPLLASAAGTAWLVSRAQGHNRKNTGAAMRELMDFTGYSADRIGHLWSVSNEELAKNWRRAGVAEDDREQMAGWYRDNSELYLFAISAYNLEYKRIRSNLSVLKLARGSCLDYGAGNGELILELARRGHPAAYYDVEGETMKFARWQAQQQCLTVEFPRSKEELTAAARRRGFDTVLSLDVLEHLPDLPGELNFLSSLLNPGGRLVFNVPAGATKSHPMHLNHSLDVSAHLLAKGLAQERSRWQKLPFKKEQEYVFHAHA